MERFLFCNTYTGPTGHNTRKIVMIKFFRSKCSNRKALKSHDLQLVTLNVTVKKLQLLLLFLQMFQYTSQFSLCWLMKFYLSKFLSTVNLGWRPCRVHIHSIHAL
jgi:hypothetical protein